MSKALIAYFSHAGQNYSNSVYVTLLWEIRNIRHRYCLIRCLSDKKCLTGSFAYGKKTHKKYRRRKQNGTGGKFMKCSVENEKLITEKDGKTYSFTAHAEEPRPSMLGLGIKAGGKS